MLAIAPSPLSARVCICMRQVGYGDLSPTSGASQLFTLLMIFIGIIVVFPLVGGTLSSYIFTPLTAKGRELMDRAFPSRTLDVTGSGSADFKLPSHPAIYYLKNLTPSLVLTLVVQVVFALGFVAVEEWRFFTALYHCAQQSCVCRMQPSCCVTSLADASSCIPRCACQTGIVTSTTVGYGDCSIQTWQGMLLATVHILTAVVLLGELLETLGSIWKARADQLRLHKQLQAHLDERLIMRLLKRTKELHDEDHSRTATAWSGAGDEGGSALCSQLNGTQIDVAGVSPLGDACEGALTPTINMLEFLLGMLLEIKAIEWIQLVPLMRLFRRFDVSQDGALSFEDLRLMATMTNKEMRRSEAINAESKRTRVSYAAAGSPEYPLPQAGPKKNPRRLRRVAQIMMTRFRQTLNGQSAA